MKKAFTLIEVNLAMLIMAGGILALVGLYALGFRENAQSIEDVNGAAFADAVISEATKVLSQTDLKWTEFNSLQTNPERGWRDYLEERNQQLLCIGDPSGKAQGVFGSINVGGSYSAQLPTVPSGMVWGMVVSRAQDSAMVTIAVRVAKEAKTLMSQPLFVTQVRFQGKQQ